VAVLTGGAGSWRRIELADGTAGFARAVDLAPADEPLRREPLARPVALRSRPDSSALVLTELPAGAEVAVLGGLGDWTLVAARAAVPVRGWLAPDALIFPRP
jgi:SH3-like domain-containing protein